MPMLHRAARDGGTTPALSMCFGGGGFLAMAFGLGVVDGLRDAGVRTQEAPMLGTSGGAWAAGAAALGLPLADLLDVASQGKEDGVAHSQITRRAFGEARDARVLTTAVDRRTGRLRVLHGDVHPVADVVGASSAAPGLFPPYPLAGRRYVDGGLYSPTAAHLAPRARVLVVASPMASRLLGAVGTGMARLLRQELLLWRLRTGGQVLWLRPDRAFAAEVGKGFRTLLDADRAPRVYEAARALAAQRAVELTDRAELALAA
jgi:hypothetical protein